MLAISCGGNLAVLLEIFWLNERADEIGFVLHFVLREKTGVEKPHEESPHCRPDCPACGAQIFRWNTLWPRWGLRAELTAATANWTVWRDPDVVRSNPRALRVTKPVKPGLVVINHTHRRSSFRDPEFQICVVARELMDMLRREPLDLFSNELGPRD